MFRGIYLFGAVIAGVFLASILSVYASDPRASDAADCPQLLDRLNLDGSKGIGQRLSSLHATYLGVAEKSANKDRALDELRPQFMQAIDVCSMEFAGDGKLRQILDREQAKFLGIYFEGLIGEIPGAAKPDLTDLGQTDMKTVESKKTSASSDFDAQPSRLTR